jgi:hypothetical protein
VLEGDLYCGKGGQYPNITWQLAVYDQFNHPLPGAVVTLVNLNANAMYFISDYDFTIPAASDYKNSTWRNAPGVCTSPRNWNLVTDAQGLLTVHSIVIADPGTNQMRPENYRMTVSKDGTSLWQDISLRVYGRQGDGTATSCISKYAFDVFGCRPG